MREQVVQVIESYIEAVRRNDAGALPLHPEVVGEFPLNTYRGAEAYRQALDPFHRLLKRIEVVRLIADDEHCVVILNLDTVFGRIAMAEHLTVVDGKIVWIRGYYDPRPIIAGSERGA